MCSALLGAALVLIPLTSPAAQAGSDRPPPRIGAIEIVGHEVFDEPTRGISAPYRVANKIHIQTRERVIRRELLFAVGDALNPELLAQTERNLRALPFLRDASVETIPAGANGDEVADRVDVRVVVWDTWSLAPRLQFERVDDSAEWEVGVSELNLLGLGKEVSVSHQVTLDRTASRFLYRDPQLAGSRFVLTTAAADLSDGDEGFLALDRPFYSLVDEWAFAVRAAAFTRQDPLFQNGTEIGHLRHLARRGDFEIARAVRRRPASALRLHAAYRLRDEWIGNDRRDFGIVEVGLRSVTHRFVRLTHVSRFERAEDLNLGPQTYGRFGVSTSAFGGQVGRVLFLTAGHTRTVAFSPTHFLVGALGGIARREQGRWTNVRTEARLRYLRKHSTRHTLIGKIDFRIGHNLDPEIQLLLGADNGLRGYPVRRFEGTRSLLLSAEERWFVADDVGQLLSVGVAAFLDSGFAWPDQTSVDLADLKTAVGASLLLGGNCLSAGPGVRFNLAYALDPVTNAGRWVFSSLSRIEF